MASFRRTFLPTPEEQIHDLEMVLRLHTEQIGYCSTCENYIASNMPGFVTDYGNCRVDSPVFAEKMCGIKDEKCSLYAEKSVEPIKEEIERIKKSRPPERQEDPTG